MKTLWFFKGPRLSKALIFEVCQFMDSTRALFRVDREVVILSISLPDMLRAKPCIRSKSFSPRDVSQTCLTSTLHLRKALLNGYALFYCPTL